LEDGEESTDLVGIVVVVEEAVVLVLIHELLLLLLRLLLPLLNIYSEMMDLNLKYLFKI
jgi:hypothetical protein